jgi:hypothetical protein
MAMWLEELDADRKSFFLQCFAPTNSEPELKLLEM